MPLPITKEKLFSKMTGVAEREGLAPVSLRELHLMGFAYAEGANEGVEEFKKNLLERLEEGGKDHGQQ